MLTTHSCGWGATYNPGAHSCLSIVGKSYDTVEKLAMLSLSLYPDQSSSSTVLFPRAGLRPLDDVSCVGTMMDTGPMRDQGAMIGQSDSRGSKWIGMGMDGGGGGGGLTAVLTGEREAEEGGGGGGKGPSGCATQGWMRSENGSAWFLGRTALHWPGPTRGSGVDSCWSDLGSLLPGRWGQLPSIT
jgi:hypothetical protein